MPPPTLRAFLSLPPPSPLLSCALGNSASDLDSLISAVCLSFGLHLRDPDAPPVTPLANLPPGGLRLRPDYAYLAAKLGLPPPLDAGPFFRQLADASLPPPSLHLVDGNTVTTNLPFPPPHAARVLSIHDHHADAGEHLRASPRVVVVPCGSTCSLLHCRLFSPLPSPPAPHLILPLALLLVTAMVDTSNFSDAAGKTTALDLRCRDEVRAYLASFPAATLAEELGGSSVDELYEGCVAARFERGFWEGLSFPELVEMDYKAFGGGGKKAGVASVLLPVGMLGRDGMEAGEWGGRIGKELDGLVVMAVVKEEGGGARREFAAFEREGVEGGVGDFVAAQSGGGAELELERDAALEERVRKGVLGDEKGWRVVAGRQHNMKGSRKILAPLLVEFLEAGKDA
ncbi:hypothetical protein TeGR_g13943 [Tetraparma gracilis]|uniref:DHHA2 domain-containing protein n=1 Tax=Tetraparma gracilis TaxID=2962635 RepID=A0ABQ6MHA5_9STRA|nr:hypothetical protein TeGR_g13943 [Tetraparma gracilis]